MDSLRTYLPTSIKGKRILLTGGTTGIGRAAAINRLDTETACFSMIADAADQRDFKRIFDMVDSQFKGLDILINNAALPYESIIQGNYQHWQYIINTNLLGSMACCNEAVKRMKGDTGRHIVNIGSINTDERGKDSSVYVATKAGIQGFNESLRKEVNDLGIKVIQAG